MTIRASWGLFRDYPDFYESEYVKTSPPYKNTIVITAPAGGTPAGFANPYLGYPCVALSSVQVGSVYQGHLTFARYSNEASLLLVPSVQ
jgi:hypothetical protein